MLEVVKPGFVKTDRPRQDLVGGAGSKPARDLKIGDVHGRGWTVESVTVRDGMVSATGARPDGQRFALHVKESKEIPVR